MTSTAGTATAAVAPYVGLTHYTENEAELFFGRDTEAAVIIGNLRASRLTLLYAESGVGKSSVLRAAVVARLRELATRDAETRGAPGFVPVVFSAWSSEPVAGLIEAIEEAIRPFPADDADQNLPRGRLEDAIEAATRPRDTTLLLILDQFEEHFLYRARQDGGEPFADQLARCITRPDLGVNVLISIREDAYAGLGDLFRGRIANVYANFVHLEYLDRAGAREAIEQPLERLNRVQDAEPFAVEPALVEAVLDRVRHGARGGGEQDGRGPAEAAGGTIEADEIETTYLQLVMKRLWEEEQAAGSRLLRLETLERLGGADAIIDEHLDRVLDALPADEQDTAASIFTFLVTKGGTKIALTTKDLSELSNLPEPQLDPVLQRLAGADLHILRPVDLRDPTSGRAYEIFHDALARPIVEWRQAKLDARLEQERERRQEAERRVAKERNRRRLAVGVAGLLVLALLGIGLAVVIVQANRNTDKQRRIAKAIESADRITALAISPRFGPVAAAVASVEAYRLAPEFEPRSRTLAALQTNVGFPTIAVGHTRSVLSVAFFPKAPLLASGSADGTVRLWNREGRPLRPPLLTDSNAVVGSLAVGAQGTKRSLAAARGDGSVDLWDVTDPAHARRLWTKKVSEQYVRAVAFSPDGTTLAAAGDEGQIHLWDVKDPGHPTGLGSTNALGAVYSLAFSPDGRFLATASDYSNPGVQIWAVAGFGGTNASQPTLLTDKAAQSVAWSPDGWLAAGMDDDDSGIRLWRVHGLRAEPGSRFISTTDRMNGLAFARGGSVLVSGGDDWSVTTWDVETGRPFGPPRMQGQSATVHGVAVSSDGRVASAGDYRLVKIWPIDDRSALAATIGSLGPADIGDRTDYRLPIYWDLALGPHGSVAAAAADGGAVIYKVDASRLVPHRFAWVMSTKGDKAWAVAYYGDRLAVAFGKTVSLYDTGPSCKGMPPRPCPRGSTAAHPVHEGELYTVAFDRTGRVLASGDEKGVVVLWDVSKAGDPVRRHTFASEKQNILDLVFDPTADILAVGGGDGTIRLWNVHDPARPVRLGAPLVGHERQIVASLAFSPDGTLLASGGGDQQVVLWQVDQKKGVVRLPRTLSQTNTILSLAFSPDGKVLAAGDGDGSTCLYDVESLRSIGADDCLLSGYSGTADHSGIQATTFTANGKSLLTAGRGSPVVSWSSVLWSLDKGSQDTLRSDVCRLAGRNLTDDEWNNVFGSTPFAKHRHKTCPNFP